MTPSVAELLTAPQIAALHILDLVLETTITALTAAHADLLWDEEPERTGLQFDRWSKPALARAAEDIVERAAVLRYAIANYCPDLTPPWEAHQLPLDPGAKGGPPFWAGHIAAQPAPASDPAFIPFRWQVHLCIQNIPPTKQSS